MFSAIKLAHRQTLTQTYKNQCRLKTIKVKSFVFLPFGCIPFKLYALCFSSVLFSYTGENERNASIKYWPNPLSIHTSWVFGRTHTDRSSETIQLTCIKVADKFIINDKHLISAVRVWSYHIFNKLQQQR